MQTLQPGADATLAALLAQAWRATPAATAVKWSRGEWQRQPHLTLISDALAAMAEGPIRLIISVPPRHGKSLVDSVWLPIWFLVNWPTGRIGLASYAADFASDWGLRVRRIIEQTPELGISVSKDRARAHDWDLEEGGGMMTAGVGGPFTGRGFDLLIIDDPIKNRAEANSATYRKHLWDWWTSTARTRLEPGGSIVVVATRWHEDDLIGRLLNGPQGDDEFAAGDVDLDEWQYIRLPALAEDNDPLGREEGEPLWPARYDARALAALRVELGPQDWAGLFQQRPTEMQGGLFKLSWWQFDDVLPPATGGTEMFLDTAFKTSESADYSACATLYPTDNSIVLKEMWRERLEFPDLIRAVINLAEKHQPTRVYIEDAASGQSAIQALRSGTRLPIIPVKVSSDKVSRATAVTGLVEAGRVVLPRRAPWLNDFLDEVSAFPAGQHDDQVDAFVMGLTQLGVTPRWSVVIPD